MIQESAHTYEPVLPVAEVIALEQRIASEGTSLKELMSRAGAALTQCILNWWSISGANTTTQPKAVIFTGSGNNGGDGWVVADLLAKQNWAVTIVCSKPAEDLKAEPARETALEIIRGWAAEDHSAKILLAPTQEELLKELQAADVTVDGILGTSFSGSSIREPYASWIKLANQEKAARENRIARPNSNTGSSTENRASQLLSVAADVPSGLSADAGTVADPCFFADTTVTMLAYKPGLILPESIQWTGKLILAPLV